MDKRKNKVSKVDFSGKSLKEIAESGITIRDFKRRYNIKIKEKK